LDHGYVLVHVPSDVKKTFTIAAKNTSDNQAKAILDKIQFLFQKGVSAKDILILCPYEST
jgi:hypothetical protein